MVDYTPARSVTDTAVARAERLFILSGSRVTRFLALVWLKYHEEEEKKKTV
jgi:hypothetical protein